MNENSQGTTIKENSNNKNSMVAFSGDIKKALESIRKEFGYDTISQAARNAAIVGYGEFQNNPKDFIQKLNNVKLN